MDARITKARLSNLLSYDWLKILLTIAAAVAVLAVTFTIVRTRPTAAQRYDIYSLGGLVPGTENGSMSKKLDEKFSYDILEVTSENFAEGTLGSTAFTARRGVLRGNALFVADYPLPDAAEDDPTPFESICANGLVSRGTPEERLGMFYDIPQYFDSCEAYLTRFFGEDWATSPKENEAEMRACFLQRNGKDKRFKTDVQKEAGVELEKARLRTLREDYLFVKEKQEEGVFSVFSFEHEHASMEGTVVSSYPVAIGMGKLSRFTSLYYYEDTEGRRTAEQVRLLFFDNGEALADLKYESVTLLRYLLEQYA